MKYSYYYIENEEGKSNCVIRTFCKLYNKKYEEVYNELCVLSKELNCSSFNDVLVFETYMQKNETFEIECDNDIKIKDLILDNGKYVVFCWDKNDYYHMVLIDNNVLIDKTDDSMDLYVLKIYESKSLIKK